MRRRLIVSYLGLALSIVALGLGLDAIAHGRVADATAVAGLVFVVSSIAVNVASIRVRWRLLAEQGAAHAERDLRT